MSYVREGARDWWPALDMRSCASLIKINHTHARDLKSDRASFRRSRRLSAESQGKFACLCEDNHKMCFEKITYHYYY